MIVAAYRIERQIEVVMSEQRDIDSKKQQAKYEAEQLTKGMMR